jgi:hypothetical protein
MKNRRCRNRAPHDAHIWRGLNTRGDGYQCPGVAQVIDLMQALKDALRAADVRGARVGRAERPPQREDTE